MPLGLDVGEADAPAEAAGEAGAAVAAAQSEVAALPFQVTVTSAPLPAGRRRARSVWPTGQVTESHTCWEPEETRTPRAWLPTSIRQGAWPLLTREMEKVAPAPTLTDSGPCTVLFKVEGSHFPGVG